MNKKELIEAVAGKTGQSKSETETILATIIDTIKQGVKDDGDVSLSGFGTFKLVHRNARKGRNPKTGEEIDIPASKSVGFKVSKTVKEAL